ncbi:ABC transporter ATP-binding protein [Catenulispora sp. NL8]|uniref:ABC transporter ATP-binding protein n=1 Tax=Catenulispora pinistramenti TaxID=2705254 RepID=A0ABS5KRI9_9ACTN|nr:ABC transporter ATP-binding protein [Catenulispora pinistramenti]MBS2548667.1 ABC transporter ATP-binding protein [Catenulispora pinistramenti]
MSTAPGQTASVRGSQEAAASPADVSEIGSGASAGATYPGAIASDAATARLLPVADNRRCLAWATGYARRRPGLLAAALGAMVVTAAMGLAAPLATGEIVQALVERRGRGAAIGPVIRLALAVLVGALAARAAGRLSARLVLPAVAELREDVLAAAVALPVDVAEAGGSGDLISRVCNDVDQITDAAQESLADFTSAALAICAAFIGLAALDWRFLLAALPAVPIQLWTLRWYLRSSRPVYAAGRIAEGRRTESLLGTFAALPTVRALRLGPARRAAAAQSSLDAVSYEIQATRLATRFYGRLNGAELIGLGTILATAAVLIHDGGTTVGAATSAALFFVGLFNPINTVLGVFDDLQQAGAGIARLLGVRDHAAVVVPASGRGAAADTDTATATADTDADADASLVIDEVSFRYGPPGGPGRPGTPEAVSGISIDIAPDRHVAVVGVSGSGKSTLAGLAAGLYTPGSGSVTIGGTPVAGRVALIAQQPHLFAGTVADNLRLAAPKADDAQISAALTATGALPWVSALPQGTDTLIGAGGHPLTGGQAQHLALARLLLLDPPFVILDEATAEGGSDAARSLDAAARAAIRDRGALIIAHRLSQVVAAAQIVVLADGRAVERGTHDELLAADGHYAHLWQAWSRHRT